MGFTTKFLNEYNFHYTKGIDYPSIKEYLDEIIKIINNPSFIKNMNAIWDLRYCKIPDGNNKFNLLLQFIEGAKKISRIKGDNYKTAILVDTIKKYNDLSNYIILAKENKLTFEVNIFTDIYEALFWFEIKKSHYKKILKTLLND